MTERENLTALDLCGIYTGVEGGCPPISEDLTNWEILLDSNKPVVEDLPYLPVSLLALVTHGKPYDNLNF